jgi:hypothetical protein
MKVITIEHQRRRIADLEESLTECADFIDAQFPNAGVNDLIVADARAALKGQA